MSLSGTSPRSHTIITTTANTRTTTTTSTQPITDTAATATTATTATPTRSSPPKDDSPTGRSKRTIPPRSPRAMPMPVPVLRLRSTSSSLELSTSPRKRPPLAHPEGRAPLSQSHPVPDISREPSKPHMPTTVTLPTTEDAVTESVSVRAFSEPSLQIVRKSIPLAQLKKMEQAHRMHKLADLLVNDLVDGSLSAAKLNVLGSVDSAFYTDRLPKEFKTLGVGMDIPTISSSKLLQRYFATDFQTNVGWDGATSLYANFMRREKARSTSTANFAMDEHYADVDASSIDADTRQAEIERMQGAAEVIVRTLLGYPPTVDSSPLPDRLLSLLMACDQRLHAKLLDSDRKVAFTTDQIRAGRLALLTNLLVKRLLQPMLLSLAPKMPSQTEIWFQAMLMKGLASGAEQLSTALFNKSFASSPLALQQQATEKLTREKIDARIRQLQTKPSTRHVRTRSADTTPISPRTLRTIEEARHLRKVQKAGEMARELESQDWSTLEEANREIDENIAIAKAQEALQQFNVNDLEGLVMELLGERGDGDYTPVSPRRAQPLDDSEELVLPDEASSATMLTSTSTVTTTAQTFTTTTTTTAPTTATINTSTASRTSGAALRPLPPVPDKKS